MSLITLTTLAIATKLLVGVSAQNGNISTDAMCGPTYDWVNSGVDQSLLIVSDEDSPDGKQLISESLPC